MRLHEAMVEVLRERGGGWMDRDEIANEIALRDLFRRPSDGAHPPSDQLRLRARKPEYQHLFECSDTRCSKIRLRSATRESAGSARAPAPDPQESETTAAPREVPRWKPTSSIAWYEELRARYRPKNLRYLLIAESPPDPGAGERRFFYSPALTIDNLYRGVAMAVYGERNNMDLRNKTVILEALQADGFWLIDAVDYPVNKLDGRERTRAIREALAGLIKRCTELAPELGVIVCHGKVFAAVAPALRAAGISVLHDEPLPFPLGNWRSEFIEGFGRALRRSA